MAQARLQSALLWYLSQERAPGVGNAKTPLLIDVLSVAAFEDAGRAIAVRHEIPNDLGEARVLSPIEDFGVFTSGLELCFKRGNQVRGSYKAAASCSGTPQRGHGKIAFSDAHNGNSN